MKYDYSMHITIGNGGQLPKKKKRNSENKSYDEIGHVTDLRGGSQKNQKSVKVRRGLQPEVTHRWTPSDRG